LADWGASLGSDVAFFLGAAAAAAWCTGRGERVEPAQLGRPLWLVLACPIAGLATADVYRGVAVPDQPLSGDALRRAVELGDIAEIGRGLHNRLQPVAERLRPEIAAVRARLEALRPAGLLMSGSGSSLFALGHDHADALRIARQLRDGGEEGVSLRVFLARSCN
jgi:4-diphosphocytidyl-2-C-methyl-D-erythritol kinase